VARGRDCRYFRYMARRPGTLLLAALWCAVAFLALLAVAYGSSGARSLDARALHGFIDLRSPGVEGRVSWVAALGNPLQVGLMAALLTGVALIRGRPRLAVSAVLLLGLTSISSQFLKEVLAYPRLSGLLDGAHVSPAAFPSGHATAAMSIALAAVLVVPTRARPLAAVLGTVFALAVSFCVVALGWHFPSDIVGGFLLATFWTLVVAAALAAASSRWPERADRTRLTASLQRAADWITTAGTAALAAMMLGVLALVGATLLVSRFADLVNFAGQHTSLLAVIVAIAVAAAAVLGGVTVALRRS
jgi:membrane-associated phospholipid phosphatase